MMESKKFPFPGEKSMNQLSAEFKKITEPDTPIEQTPDTLQEYNKVIQIDQIKRGIV